jgi:hypothetical protein
LIEAPRPLLAAPLDMRRRHLIVVPKPLPCLLGRGAQAVARGATRFAPQVLDRGAQAVARGAATLSQPEKKSSAGV